MSSEMVIAGVIGAGVIGLLQLVISIVKLRGLNGRRGALPSSGSVLTEKERDTISVMGREVTQILQDQGQAIRRLSESQALMLSKILKVRERK